MNEAVRNWFDRCTRLGGIKKVRSGRVEEADTLLYRNSLKKFGEKIYLFALKLEEGRYVGSFPDNRLKLNGEYLGYGKERIFVAPYNGENTRRLREAVPFLSPVPLPREGVSFGTGDRLGLATPGHARVMNRYEAHPVFAQQSVRELELMGRSYRDVIDDVCWGILREGYEQSWSADGDHLKTAEWIDEALRSGCTMITADLSEHIRGRFARVDIRELKAGCGSLSDAYVEEVKKRYLDRSFLLPGDNRIEFDEEELFRSVLIYREAVEYAYELYTAACARNIPFSFEISIDETGTPTTPQAHIFVARELERRGIDFVSLAPRFIGEFQKGIDYIGDVDLFRRDFSVHDAVARDRGYKISVHSGSDKFSIFPIVGEIADNFHVKTSGTNWLEALRTISRIEPDLFRRIHGTALEVFPEAQKYYHVTPDLDTLTDPESLEDSELERVFGNTANRQVLHICYGELFKDSGMRGSVYSALAEKEDAYEKVLGDHIGKHLDTLGVRKRK